MKPFRGLMKDLALKHYPTRPIAILDGAGQVLCLAGLVILLLGLSQTVFHSTHRGPVLIGTIWEDVGVLDALILLFTALNPILVMILTVSRLIVIQIGEQTSWLKLHRVAMGIVLVIGGVSILILNGLAMFTQFSRESAGLGLFVVALIFLAVLIDHALHRWAKRSDHLGFRALILNARLGILAIYTVGIFTIYTLYFSPDDFQPRVGLSYFWLATGLHLLGLILSSIAAEWRRMGGNLESPDMMPTP